MPARKELNLESFDGSFAKRMLELRKSAGLKSNTAADRIGVSSSALAKWENSRTRPTVLDLPRIAAAYGVKVRDLFPENF